MQLLRFTATIVLHFARSHATRPTVRTVNNFESAREAHEGEGSIFEPFLRRRCFSPGGTRRMERCTNGDARNRKFFGCSAGESVEFVDRGFASVFFCPKDVNLDLIFRLLKNSSDISLHRTIRIVCQKKKKIPRELLLETISGSWKQYCE